MQLRPYINFDGDCAEALAFYADCLNGQIEYKQTYGESPMAGDVPEDWHEKIIHSQFVAGDTVLLASDSFPGRHEQAQGFQITVEVDDQDEAERVFDALSEGGQVQMPLEETFWASRFGMLKDRYGIPWMVNCE